MKGKFVGHCTRCGKCCVEAWRFNYQVEPKILPHKKGAEKQTQYKWEQAKPEYLQEKPKDWKGCNSYKIVDGLPTCTCNDNKPEVCKRWPILPSDLEQIDCPGIKWIPDKEESDGRK